MQIYVSYSLNELRSWMNTKQHGEHVLYDVYFVIYIHVFYD